MNGAAGTARATGLVLLDVDRFKRVNDSYGHPAGDQVLVQVARRLKALLRERDAVVRWGGEEFLLIVEGKVLPGRAGEHCRERGTPR